MSPFELISRPEFGVIRYLLLATLLIATVTDLHRRKIPNLLTFLAALVAFVIHAKYSGFSGLVASVLAYFSWFALGFLFYRTLAGKEIGAGDIKLLMAISACIGFMPAAYVTFVSLAMSVLFLFVSWLFQGTARANFAGLYAWLSASAAPGVEKVHFRPVGSVDRTPHAPFMLAAALLCFYLYRHGILIHF